MGAVVEGVWQGAYTWPGEAWQDRRAAHSFPAYGGCVLLAGRASAQGAAFQHRAAACRACASGKRLRTCLRVSVSCASSCFAAALLSCACARHVLGPNLSSSSRLAMRFSWCSSCALALSSAARHAATSPRLFCGATSGWGRAAGPRGWCEASCGHFGMAALAGRALPSAAQAGYQPLLHVQTRCTALRTPEQQVPATAKRNRCSRVEAGPA